MSQDDTLMVNDSRTTKVGLQGETHAVAKRYVEQENRRSPLYKVSLQAVVNVAVLEYCTARLEEDSRTEAEPVAAAV